MKPGNLFATGVLCLFGVVASTTRGATTHYVDINSTNPISPYLEWPTAATNIQQAVNAAPVGDQVLVRDGIYRPFLGQATTVSVNNNIQIRSVNGPASTIIEGNPAGPPFTAGVELLSPCVLDGFTVRNGGSSGAPSGIRVSSPQTVVTNCIIARNMGGGINLTVGFGPPSSVLSCIISNNAGPGVGGSLGSLGFLCKLTNCVIADNLGRGAVFCSLSKCLVTGNLSTNLHGAGLADCYAENSLIISNRATR